MTLSTRQPTALRRSLSRAMIAVAVVTMISTSLPMVIAGQPIYPAGTYAWPGSANAFSGYPNTSYSPVIPLSLPQTNLGFLPTGGYSSQYYRVPTTYYRPVTTFDPALGTTVTSLMPCTSYQYQAQRVPVLTPAWQNYPYGNYASTLPQNRWPSIGTAPVATPTVGSATGQSSMSIASGFGTYGSAPVVQPQTAGFPAAPGLPPFSNYPSNYPLTSLPPGVVGTPSGTIVTGSAPSVAGYGSFTAPGVPPIITTVLGTSQVVPAADWNASSSLTPNPAISSTLPPATWAPMPGSIGMSAIPPAISPTPSVPISPSPTLSYPSTPRTVTAPVFPSILPSTPSTSIPSSNFPSAVMPAPGLPTPASPTAPTGGSSVFDREATVTPSLKPVEPPPLSTVTEEPRFQLRAIERSTPSSPLIEPPPVSPSPWSRNPSTLDPAAKPTETGRPEGSPQDARDDFELELNTESLRPIPAPKDFDAAPEWKPPLLQARDQTASLPPPLLTPRCC
jgi:hypothetical protein